MRPEGRSRINYANVMSTVAVFLALGGGAWAASGGFVSSGGEVRGCVPTRGGVLRIVHPQSRCRRGEESLLLAHSPQKGPTGVTGSRGTKGTTGSRGVTGATGTVGATGTIGPAGPANSYSIGLGPFVTGTLESPAFGGNRIRLHCASGECSAQVAAGGTGEVLGVVQNGTSNGPVTATSTIHAETPAVVTLGSITLGVGAQADVRATVWVRGEAAWEIDVHLAEAHGTGLGGGRLVGTAIPASINECSPTPGGEQCS